MTGLRRKSRRIGCNVSFLGGGAATNLSGRITDLSGTGLFLITNRLIPVGKQVHLEFELRTGKVEAVGEVRWVDKGPPVAGLGIRFLRLSAASARAIDEAVAAC
ncbi:MAG: PilZ domain-containing protein [Myxococcales bacterium]|nr:PilZ domain-containing protein [Myxococcales bacterium]